MAQTTDEATAELTNHPKPETTKGPPCASPNSNHDSQDMNTVTVNEHQTSITTKRLTSSNKSYKDLDDESISRMMSIDDANAIEMAAERAKKST